uniref:Probable GTP-binding protein EngB n=1 Tax=Candidatus Aschnera chinzeii TaxID=1485666 RepID=A0AAT9G4H9_9ENTR|nr:MAG: ribosome biogenesis GTP-binding protein YihA/YsxC [Candidatus Aschnera chinzeii]
MNTLINKYIFYHTKFIGCASDVDFLPYDFGIEIAFAGYSNVGKSSVLNTISNQSKLSYTSKIPGRTHTINIFEIINGIKLVDLPGYGYVKRYKIFKNEFFQILINYFKKRRSLKGIFIMMDIRNPLKILDYELINFLLHRNMNIYVLLTKSDKLSVYQQNNQLKLVHEKLQKINKNIEVTTFSSLKKTGINHVYHKLNTWFFT